MSNLNYDFGDYLHDILEQPEALRRTAAALYDLQNLRDLAERLRSGYFHSVVLTGMGASYHALHPLWLELIAHGLNVHHMETSELIYHAPRLLAPRALVIAVSQSGESIEIVKLLERTRAANVSVIGVTNTAQSTLAREAHATAMMRAGMEATVSCKTYIASLAALLRLADALTGQELNEDPLEIAAAAMQQYLAQWFEHVAELEAKLQGIENVVLVGRGPSLAAVGTGALIIEESAHFPAQAMSSAAFRHGPLEMLSAKLFVLTFAGIEPTIQLNAGLVADIRAAGGRTALITESQAPGAFSLPPVHPRTLPLLEILVPQMFSLALAKMQGHIPGKFERLSKVMREE